MSIIVLGKNGQVGRAVAAQLGGRAFAFDRTEVDLALPDFIAQLDAKTTDKNIRAVINAAAYTNVDGAEGAGRDEAFRVNAAAVGELAQWCKTRNVRLVHFSTDYVFDGSGQTPWVEGDTPHPLNVYGQSKLDGENANSAAGCEAFILRTSWVYDEMGKNFLTTMLRLFREKTSLNIVADQIGAPTYALELAQAAIAMLEKPEKPYGIYHVCGGGETSWHGFAKTIFALASKYDSSFICKEIHAISTAHYPTPAKRPHNSRLNCIKAEKTFGLRLALWEDALTTAIQNIYAGDTNRNSRP